MDIFTYIKKDHEAVSALFKKAIAAKGQQRQQYFETIAAELLLHAKSEEKTFYAAIKEQAKDEELQDKMPHAKEEHEEIVEWINNVSKEKTDSDQWLIAFGELKHAVEHHVKEEEEEIFPKAKKVIDKAQAVELAKKMDELKASQKKKMAA